MITLVKPFQGRIQTLKKGGGGIHRMSLVQPCGACSQRSFLYVHIMQSVIGGSGAPTGKFLNLDHMRVFLEPSETIITTQNLWQLDFGDSLYGRVSEPLPFGINYCLVPPLSLGSCRFECFMFAGHEAVDLYGDVCCV